MINHPDEKEAALFRRGAIESLAEMRGVVIVATYTKLLTEVDPAGSSKVCRYPVAVPLLDIDGMAQTVTEFNTNLPNKYLSGAEAGLVLSVRFRLAQKISDIGLLALHGYGKVDEMTELCRSFAEKADSEGNLSERLKSLQTVVVAKSSGSGHLHKSKSAALLLCGIPESEWGPNTVKRQISDTVLTDSGFCGSS
jgi:hypothetical protein